MRSPWIVMLSLALLSPPAHARGDAGGDPGAKRLASAGALSAAGRAAEALEALLVLVDEQPGDARVRLAAIDQLGRLAQSHAPAGKALKVRRDSALAKLGPSPAFTPELQAVFALNRALGESDSSGELARRAAGGPAADEGRPADPMPPAMSRASIRQRAADNRTYQLYQAQAPAVAFLAEELEAAKAAADLAEAEKKQALAELEVLTQTLAGVESGSPEEWKLLYRTKMVQSYIENELTPTLESLGREIIYYEALKLHRERAGG